MSDDLVHVRTALISVYDKSGLDLFARDLYMVNPELTILSSGGTARQLRDALDEPYRSRVMDIAEYTGFPESPGDLVKTLHPKVHAGLLMDTDDPEHVRFMEEHSITPIDLAVISLYPFSKVLAQGGTPQEVMSMIDIGGPAMIRAAAKRFKRVAVLTNPEQYSDFIGRVRSNDGATDFTQRSALRTEAFRVTAEYDAAIHEYYAETTPAEEKAVWFPGGETVCD